MMNFKDLVKEDKKVFLNLSEFAEQMDVNGLTITAILQDPEVTEYKPSSEYGEGLQSAQKVLIVDSEDVPTPRIGQIMDVNGTCYNVQNVSGSGILHIKLEESI